MSYIHNCIRKVYPSKEDNKGLFEKTTQVSIEGRFFNKLHVAFAMHQYSDFWNRHNLKPFVYSISKVAAISLVLSISFACGEFINSANAAYPDSNPTYTDWPINKEALNNGGVKVENLAKEGGYYYDRRITGDALDNSFGWIWGTTPPQQSEAEPPIPSQLKITILKLKIGNAKKMES